jgi:hypothetical protein
VKDVASWDDKHDATGRLRHRNVTSQDLDSTDVSEGAQHEISTAA